MKTPRTFWSLVVLTALAATVAGQDQPPPDKDKGKGPDDKSADLVSRVAKNMQAAEKRLKDTDPGDETRKIQRDIIDDLDELIKQNKKGQSGSKKGQQKDKSGQQKDKGNEPKVGPDQNDQKDPQGDPKEGDDNMPGKAKTGEGERPQGKEKDKGKGDPEGKDDKEGVGKGGGDKPDDKKGVAKGQEPGQDPAQVGGLGNIKSFVAKAKVEPPPDLSRGGWPFLSEKKRLEMDTYSKERFMPRYDEQLQQYYRTIAEQGRKKDE
jgi:hypothetical protein